LYCNWKCIREINEMLRNDIEMVNLDCNKVLSDCACSFNGLIEGTTIHHALESVFMFLI
jgi:hypothetical protein